MKKQLFDDLVESIKEAGRIHRGEIKASRTAIGGQAAGDAADEERGEADAINARSGLLHRTIT